MKVPDIESIGDDEGAASEPGASILAETKIAVVDFQEAKQQTI